MAEMNRWNEVASQQFFEDAGTILDVLRHVVPEEDDQIVGLLGSSALCLFQEAEHIGPKWGNPGDFDIFVAGKHGETREAFEKYTQKISSSMRLAFCPGAAFRLSGPHVSEVYTRMNGKKVRVKDYKFGPLLKARLSFIQCPDCKDLDDVAANFDIDICRVIVRIHSGRFMVGRQVRGHIAENRAHVDPLVFCGSGQIQPRHWKCVMRTMERMRKYQKRGFTMDNSAGVQFMASTAPKVKQQLRSKRCI